jgi:SAM-dependent methyltransferase
MNFEHHNTQLSDGSWTAPDLQPMGDRGTVKQALALLADAQASTVLDLGCLEGGYSVEFARAGYQTLGLEVRDSNFARCCYTKERVNLPNLRFAQDDAWNVAEHESPYDAVFCGGLLYHMDRPIKFLKVLRGITKHLLVINTHYAVAFGPYEHHLGPVARHEGYLGRWYTEFPDEASHQQREHFRLSAWDNRQSFWLLRPELLRAVRDAGFDQVVDHSPSSDATGFNRCALSAVPC